MISIELNRRSRCSRRSQRSVGVAVAVLDRDVGCRCRKKNNHGVKEEKEAIAEEPEPFINAGPIVEWQSTVLSTGTSTAQAI